MSISISKIVDLSDWSPSIQTFGLQLDAANENTVIDLCDYFQSTNPRSDFELSDFIDHLSEQGYVELLDYKSIRKRIYYIHPNQLLLLSWIKKGDPIPQTSDFFYSLYRANPLWPEFSKRLSALIRYSLIYHPFTYNQSIIPYFLRQNITLEKYFNIRGIAGGYNKSELTDHLIVPMIRYFLISINDLQTAPLKTPPFKPQLIQLANFCGTNSEEDYNIRSFCNIILFLDHFLYHPDIKAQFFQCPTTEDLNTICRCIHLTVSSIDPNLITDNALQQLNTQFINMFNYILNCTPLKELSNFSYSEYSKHPWMNAECLYILSKSKIRFTNKPKNYDLVIDLLNEHQIAKVTDLLNMKFLNKTQIKYLFSCLHQPPLHLSTEETSILMTWWYNNPSLRT